jgi:hypothetical protein
MYQLLHVSAHDFQLQWVWVQKEWQVTHCTLGKIRSKLYLSNYSNIRNPDWRRFLPALECGSSVPLRSQTPWRWHSSVETCRSQHLTLLVFYDLYFTAFYVVHLLYNVLNLIWITESLVNNHIHIIHLKLVQSHIIIINITCTERQSGIKN